jgi:hypothetical protein
MLCDNKLDPGGIASSPEVSTAPPEIHTTDRLIDTAPFVSNKVYF